MKPGVMENLSDALEVAPAVLRDDLCFTLNELELRCQCHQILGAVAHIEGKFHNLTKRVKYGHSALPVGNANTRCIYVHHS